MRFISLYSSVGVLGDDVTVGFVAPSQEDVVWLGFVWARERKFDVRLYTHAMDCERRVTSFRMKMYSRVE